MHASLHMSLFYFILFYFISFIFSVDTFVPNNNILIMLSV